MILSQQHFFYTLFFLIAASFTFGQTSNFNYLETGQPFVKYYDQKDYKSSNSNWSIVQDKRGVMYWLFALTFLPQLNLHPTQEFSGAVAAA